MTILRFVADTVIRIPGISVSTEAMTVTIKATPESCSACRSEIFREEQRTVVAATERCMFREDA